MEFDKSRVYTALNADELKVGSNVIVSNCMSELKELVTNYKYGDTRELIRICSESSLVGRFETRANIYHFAYLVPEPEETWIVYINRRKCTKPRLASCRSDYWKKVQEYYGAKTKLFEGTEDECDEWYVPRSHLVDVMAAWEDGRTIQFFDVITDDWNDTGEPKWCTDSQYRIKEDSFEITVPTETQKQQSKHLQVYQFDNLNTMNKTLNKYDENDIVSITPVKVTTNTGIGHAAEDNIIYCVTVRE